MKSSRSVAGALLVSAFATLFMAGCAQNPDVRGGHDYTAGSTSKSPPAYLGCVKGELPGNVKTYEVDGGDSVSLFIESTDPNKAEGLVELRSTGSQHSFTAYQRDAWYDHGRLLDAALMCSKA
ncbi:MAG: hypothetical protein P0Y58_17470 [Candidatus Pseudomonas phytovorans]|uniref:Lipoprotein n=1 Tax=Candidatus Pseudomonas phytovorans TaxID=3121377 RepID=A0AAJ5WH65_9PSED|nr:hypothetical protein [Pseudomonas sp.]WEK28695.1 MAG: hypothetical protein P0Y58_17470 [Pseudomonas sp.]